ncbi:YbfB/YjiJ family MFS transporter [Streptomyces sp. KAI-26]|uniref:MFS transporter n=1 Tax=Streptomyces sp. KAI-26 TaxID=1169747 RepID=UPI0017FBFE67|nr:MFS transporter [Streptomyces sp. KAI-26]NUV90963.1 YbfB/YjiJ family MFS transporter [Streptomyces sp. KAI-26]NUW24989.1 YbfB/YjiJ family MFS transporter [Streptomyces roseoviolaceus]
MNDSERPAPVVRTEKDGNSRAKVLAAFAATVLLTSFVAATYGFGFYLFAQIVPDMRRDLGFGYTAVGTITAAAQFGFLLFAMIGTWVSTRIGGGQVVIGSVALCGVCLVLIPLSDSIVVIGVLLTILGGTAASVYVPLVEIVGRVIDYRHRGKVLGLVSSGTSYGVFVNSMLVPNFVRDDNWRGLWYSVGFGTLMVTAVAAFTFHRLGLFRQEEEVRAESEGTAGEGVPDNSARAGWRMVLVRWVVIVWTMKFLNGFACMPFQNYLSPYLREGLGFDIGFAAQVWGAIGIIGMFAGFAVGWLSDRIGVRAALVMCYTLFFLSAAILVVAPVGFLPMVSGVLFALAFYPIYGLVPAYVSKSASGAAATVIFGITNVTQGLGGIAGNYTAGFLKNVTGDFMWYYVVIAVTAVVLALLTLQLPREGSAESAIGKRPTVPETGKQGAPSVS